MNAIREQFNRPIVIGLVALLVGLIIGLIFAWGIWPVKYEGAYPRDLVYAEKVNYLRTVVEAYGRTGNKEIALQRFEAIGEGNKKALNEIINKPEGLAPELLADFSLATTGEPAVAQPQPGETQGAPVEPEATKEPAKTSGGSLLTKLWPILCVLVLVVAAILVYFFLLRGRFARTGVKSPAMEAAEARKQVAWTDFTTTGGEPPVSQFMASYKLGDDLFDDSFSIDSPAGEFLGECGVGISETVGVGEPKKVTAFEVWLFDKNDIQTVTKVVMSANAFNDLATRQRLEAKGEPVLAAPGAETVLETQTLTMTARVAGASYGAGAMPDDSYFDSFILELAVWQK